MDFESSKKSLTSWQRGLSKRKMISCLYEARVRMRSRSSKRRAAAAPPTTNAIAKGDDNSSLTQQHHHNCYEGERLASLLKSMKREIESARLLDAGVMPEKFWVKQQFSVGVNEVTRVLERMPPISDTNYTSEDKRPPCSLKLQAIILAADCNPRSLTKHLLGLASSRGVPLIFVKENNKSASLLLGQLLKLKTTISIGIKARGNAINQFVDKILLHNDIKFDAAAESGVAHTEDAFCVQNRVSL